MANLIGEGFPSFVVSQIEKRQSIYGSINRSNAQLEYLNNRNGWCKLVSSVNIDTPLRGITDTGNELARNTFYLMVPPQLQQALEVYQDMV